MVQIVKFKVLTIYTNGICMPSPLYFFKFRSSSPNLHRKTPSNDQVAMEDGATVKAGCWFFQGGCVILGLG